MKILFFTHYTNLYGANQSLLNLIDGLKKFHVEVMVIVPNDGALSSELTERNVDFQCIKFYSLWMKNNALITYFKFVIKLIINQIKYIKIKKCVKSFSPDFLYSNSSVITIGYFVAKLLRIPHIWHFREFGDLDYNLHYIFGRARFCKLAANNNNHIIFISESLKSHYQELENGNMIYNGVIREADIPSCLVKEREVFRFSFVGVLDAAKNVIEVIKAYEIANIDNTILNIYGDSGDTDYVALIRSIVHRSRLKEQIILHGFEKDKNIIFNNTDSLVMPSRNEGFGRVTAEAMAYGIIVIGYDAGGTKELIQDGYNGFLYHGDEQDLAESLLNLYQKRQEYQVIRENAQKTILKDFTTEKYSKRIYNLLRKIELQK